MTIVLASTLSFSGARCPKCNVGILPYGRSEPFAVDEAGRPYCRPHGAEADPTYSDAHAVYTRQRREHRHAAIEALEQGEPAPAKAASR